MNSNATRKFLNGNLTRAEKVALVEYVRELENAVDTAIVNDYKPVVYALKVETYNQFVKELTKNN